MAKKKNQDASPGAAFQRLGRKSVAIGADLRMRLATPDDRALIEHMNKLAGAPRSLDLLDRPLYQRGIRDALKRPGGYFEAVKDSYNAACTAGVDLGGALAAALDAASFDLIATVGEEPVAVASVGGSHTLTLGMLDQLGEDGQHQILSLLMGLPKLIAITVEETHRGAGHGRALLAAVTELTARMGAVGIYGECQDSSDVVRFYQSAGYTVLPVREFLNVYPVAGSHVAGMLGRPDDGPFLACEEGFRFIYHLGGYVHPNKTQRVFSQLNQPQVGAFAPARVRGSLY